MKIGFDCDDVLLDFRKGLHDYHNNVYGTNFERDEYYTDLAKMWDCSEEESKRRVFEFYDTDKHWNTPPVLGAPEAIKHLKKYNDLFVITSRPEEIKKKTNEWIDTYFPKMFNDVCFTNQYYGGGAIRSKGEIGKELGLDYFVDDMIHHANDVARQGIPVLLFDGPWNREKLDPGIQRVHSWDEIVQILSPQSHYQFRSLV